MSHIGEIELWLLSQRVNRQADIALAIGAESKACIGIDGGVADRYGNSHELTLLPVEHLGKFSALLQLFTGQSDIVEQLPVHLR